MFWEVLSAIGNSCCTVWKCGKMARFGPESPQKAAHRKPHLTRPWRESTAEDSCPPHCVLIEINCKRARGGGWHIESPDVCAILRMNRLRRHAQKKGAAGGNVLKQFEELGNAVDRLWNHQGRKEDEIGRASCRE